MNVPTNKIEKTFGEIVEVVLFDDIKGNVSKDVWIKTDYMSETIWEELCMQVLNNVTERVYKDLHNINVYSRE
jgi:hypothetical protein